MLIKDIPIFDVFSKFVFMGNETPALPLLTLSVSLYKCLYSLSCWLPFLVFFVSALSILFLLISSKTAFCFVGFAFYNPGSHIHNLFYFEMSPSSVKSMQLQLFTRILSDKYVFCEVGVLSSVSNHNREDHNFLHEVYSANR